ncbi:hypothetical protein GJ496_006579 [Pomphorhynchus laevis]|nr:hypothetical protein GJ496_006579 [Pomphorhynchus laevis]
MLWTEYDKKIHNTFLGNKDLYLFTEYGLDPGRKELRLRSDEYTFDLFGQENNYRCLYPPINEICSADLVGLRGANPYCSGEVSLMLKFTGE